MSKKKGRCEEETCHPPLQHQQVHQSPLLHSRVFLSTYLGASRTGVGSTLAPHVHNARHFQYLGEPDGNVHVEKKRGESACFLIF